MSRTDVQIEILDPMQQLFLSPRQMSETQQLAALGQYADALDGYSKEILAAAWVEVRAEHTRASWPPIAAFIGACKAALKARSVLEKRMEIHLSPEEEHAQRMRRFDKFCAHRGFNDSQRSVLMRPNLWWLTPRSEWKSDWHEHEIPALYRDGGRFGSA